jgi:asparagine synthase (glutamine-hydrolysing)
VCGICGQVRHDGGVVQGEILERMCDEQRHRGPDSRGIHLDGRAGLGIQRLRVIDLATGDQPIFNEDGTVAVVLNGEIYNYRELRDRLRKSGHRFATQSDTEVIAHLYEEEGAGCVRSLNGMFALAIWDSSRQRLVLARDRVGKKPLFYSHHAGGLSFASELRALLRDPEVPRELDHRALDAYLALRWIPAPYSAFCAVRKLPPASVLVLQRGRARIDRYWSLDYARKPDVGHTSEALEEIREGIRRSVRRRMVADVPLGAFLSGGIDSSAVVAAMAEASSQPVRTFSIGFTHDRYDELSKARLIAERFGTDHEELIVEPRAVEIVPRLARHYGEPFADSSAIPTFYVSELARRRVTVALTGDGGDESFAGYTRYVSGLALRRVDSMPMTLRRGLGAAASKVPASSRIDSWRSRIHRLGKAAMLNSGERHAAYLTHLPVAERLTLYSPGFRERVGGPLVPELLAARWLEASASDPLDRMLEVDVGTYLPDDLLVKMDIASMAHSLEARSPLLDHEFMELAASLPPRLKLRGMQKKVGLRAALRGWIPDSILDAPKQGFVVPIAEWLRGDLRELAYDALLDPVARARGYFQPDSVQRLLDRHVEGIEDRSQAIWTLLMFELWHREMVDGPHDPSPALSTAS